MTCSPQPQIPLVYVLPLAARTTEMFPKCQSFAFYVIEAQVLNSLSTSEVFFLYVLHSQKKKVRYKMEMACVHKDW